MDIDIISFLGCKCPYSPLLSLPIGRVWFRIGGAFERFERKIPLNIVFNPRFDHSAKPKMRQIELPRSGITNIAFEQRLLVALSGADRAIE